MLYMDTCLLATKGFLFLPIHDHLGRLTLPMEEQVNSTCCFAFDFIRNALDHLKSVQNTWAYRSFLRKGVLAFMVLVYKS